VKLTKLAAAIAVILIMTVVAAPAVSAENDKSVDLTATVLEPKPEIGIELSVDEMGFGSLLPGQTSEAQDLTVTNIGLKTVDVTATASDEEGQGSLFVDGLLVGGVPVLEYKSTLESEASNDTDLALSVPESYSHYGPVSGGATFWAMEQVSYSTALANTNPGAPDPGVPGFVGPDGDGNIGGNNYVNPAFVAWASSVVDYTRSDVGSYSDASLALGPVTGNNLDVVSLGELTQNKIDAGNAPGSLTLGFDVRIYNGLGPDFACFENGFGSQTSIFAELGYVEVSTDGVTFVRFPSVSLSPEQVGGYGQIDPTGVYNLVGKHANANGNSWGTPFDLSDLAQMPEVLDGRVDLDNINFVRIVDIPGNGEFKDSLGNPIYDAWVTVGSGGVDFEALGVLNGSPKLDAKFSANVTSGNAPLEVQFTDLSTNDPTSWEWQFGDGATSNEKHPSHTYNEVGAYTVTLTVSNAAESAVEVKANMISVIGSTTPGYLLDSSTYLGGSGEDTMSTSSFGAGDGCRTVAVASDGTIYVIGSTTSTDLSVTSGAYKATNSGGSDVFVARYSSDMSALLALTYLGGSEDDMALGIAIASDGTVYVTGYTASSGLATGGSYQTVNGGGNDAFMAKFDAPLSSLMAFTYLGGAGKDQGYTIAIGSDGIYVTGSAVSDGLATQGAYRTVRGGGDAFVAKFDDSLGHLVAFTYLGGTGTDIAFSIAIGNDGSVYVTGRTTSSGLATTDGYQKTVGGGMDAFVARFNAELSTLMAFTYLGKAGAAPEAGNDIAIAGDGTVYVAGYLGSNGLATPGAYDATFDGGAILSTNAFVARFDPNLGILQALTYFGDDFARAKNVVVTDDRVIVLMRASSNSAATTLNAFSDVSKGGDDAYVACFDLSLSSLVYGSYFGGTGNDESHGMALTSEGSVITAGYTNSTDLPMRNEVDDSHNGGNDLFLTRWVPG
jgi:PKD repeat protein